MFTAFALFFVALVVVGCVFILYWFGVFHRDPKNSGSKNPEPTPTLGSLENGPDYSEFPCDHAKATEPSLSVTVFGCQVKLDNMDEAPLCGACMEAWLNKYAARCACCEGPIFPGDYVAQAMNDSKQPFTHLSSDCCPSGGLFCGMWGQGRLFTLHELDPGKFPEGSRTMVEAAVKSGKPIIHSLH